MKDGTKGKAQKAEPRDKENNRLQNHFQKAEMDSHRGTFFDVEVRGTDNTCLDFKIALDQ